MQYFAYESDIFNICIYFLGGTEVIACHELTRNGVLKELHEPKGFEAFSRTIYGRFFGLI